MFIEFNHYLFIYSVLMRIEMPFILQISHFIKMYYSIYFASFISKLQHDIYFSGYYLK